MAVAPPAESATYTLQQILNDPFPAASDNFGSAAALDGTRALIGAAGEGSNDVGAAFLYDTTTGAVLQTFSSPSPHANDGFGSSVALYGNKALIGARKDDSAGTDIGQAYLFDTTTGALLHTFNDPYPNGGENFGGSVALDGSLALIGSPFNNASAGQHTGQVHLFDTNTGALLRTFSPPSPTTSGGYGPTLGASIDLDGTRALISAPYDDHLGNDVGQVYVYDTTTGALLQTFNDPTPSPINVFGLAVALDGDFALIGDPLDNTTGTDSGQVHVFNVTTGALLQTFNNPSPASSDQFGWSLALDGTLALISSRYDDTQGGNVGQSYLFDILTGELLWTFDDPTVTIGDLFGYALALDNGNVLITALNDDSNGSNAGQAYLYSTSPVPLPPAILLFVSALAGMGLLTRLRASTAA